jgi:hypothetical protein
VQIPSPPATSASGLLLSLALLELFYDFENFGNVGILPVKMEFYVGLLLPKLELHVGLLLFKLRLDVGMLPCQAGYLCR